MQPLTPTLQVKILNVATQYVKTCSFKVYISTHLLTRKGWLMRGLLRFIFIEPVISDDDL